MTRTRGELEPSQHEFSLRHMTKILLVEDQEISRDMLSRRLKKRGYEVAVAVDGAEDLRMVVAERPDLILMDMRLSVMDGWEAARRLKSDQGARGIPVVAVTAHAMSTDREKALAAGYIHICAIQAGTGNTVPWGDDYYGRSEPPVALDGTTGTASEIAAGGRHNLAIQQSVSGTDSDGIPDATDNCTGVANPSQLDTDGGDYGNACDFDQNLACNIADFTIFREDFIATADHGVGTDMDGNGTVSIADFSLLREGFVTGVPEPSGLVQ